MQTTLDKRVALVTGAGRGIGRAIAEALAAEGAHVLCVSQNPASCGAAAEAITASGGSAEARAVDVSDAGAVRAASEAFLEAHGQVDILVNNAGITRDTLLMRMSDDDWHSVLQTNLSSAFYWCQALSTPMARRRWGRIVNIGSVVGLMGNAGQANYAAAKAGLGGFTRSLARELAKRQVTVNLVAPGFIETDMTADLSDEVRAAVTGQIPLRRLGTPADIARTVVFLAAEEAGFITGQTFTVDGGMVM